MEDVRGQRAEADAGLRQRRWVGAPIDQRRAEPFLERADSPTERRLSHVTLLRGARKAAAVRERQEVLQPDDFEGPIHQTHGVMCIQYWTGNGFAHTVANNRFHVIRHPTASSKEAVVPAINFHGIIPATAVPFRKDLAIDEVELRRFAQWLA